MSVRVQCPLSYFTPILIALIGSDVIQNQMLLAGLLALAMEKLAQQIRKNYIINMMYCVDYKIGSNVSLGKDLRAVWSPIRNVAAESLYNLFAESTQNSNGSIPK